MFCPPPRPRMQKVLSSQANLLQILLLPPRMMELWSMARDTARSKPIISLTLSPPTNLEELAHLLIGEPMVGLLVMTFTS